MHVGARRWLSYTSGGTGMHIPPPLCTVRMLSQLFVECVIAGEKPKCLNLTISIHKLILLLYKIIAVSTGRALTACWELC